MVTRAKAGISKPLARMNCHATTTSPIPRSHLHALRDPNWHKANDGSLSRYKARLVANGRSQQQGIDFDETFSPVVKPATIRTVLSLAVTRDWPIHQLDVKNAFLYGQLSETVYMHQPPGFVDSAHPDYVCHLQPSSTALLQRIITLLHSEFAMTDLGSLNYFLGVSAQRSKSGLFLSQSKFAEEILERAHMQHCNPCKTPVDTESKLGSDGDPVSDPTLYRSLAGALQYLTFTRPDISYAVQQICLYMHDPRDPHFTALKRILRYVCGTIDHGLQLYVSSTSQLTAYTDTDWAGCPVTRRSTSGYCVFLSDNLLSWSAKRQVTLSHSSAEVEYRGVANVIAETAWIRNLLLELHTPLFTATLVYCDNVSAVYLSTNHVQHQRTKHIEIDIHFVREYVASGQNSVMVEFRRFRRLHSLLSTPTLDRRESSGYDEDVYDGGRTSSYRIRLRWMFLFSPSSGRSDERDARFIDVHEEDPEYEDDKEQDGPVDYPMDEEEEEEEKQIASADSTTVIPIVELVSSPEGTEPIIPPPDITTTGARISVRLQASVSLPSTADVERLLALPTPPLSPLTSLSPPSAGERLARLTDLPVHPSPSLPQSSVDHRDKIPKSEMQPHKRSCLFAIGSRYEARGSSTTRPTGGQGTDYEFVSTVDMEARRQGIRDVGVVELAELHEHDIQDLHALLEDAQDVWTVEEEAYAARVAWNHSIGLSQETYQELQTHRDHVYAHETHLQTHQTQLQLQSTLIQTQHQVSETRFQMQQTAMAKLRETDRGRQAQLTEALRLVRDMRQEMGDMQTELLSQREQLRRKRMPGPDAILPDHQEATGDSESHT
ncbi:ribonuclease H-like domain-containing protein [Tanacetum coccineum]|uniref:Ribonuclease H-like domain-containing protein n=1 Tax=Tanacetum coccineum TaxID=301880 RepID=A0ABQ5BK55_9ASTR